jgi:hypothetical protein
MTMGCERAPSAVPARLVTLAPDPSEKGTGQAPYMSARPKTFRAAMISSGVATPAPI